MIEISKIFIAFINGLYNIELKLFEHDIKVGFLFFGSLFIFYILKTILGIGEK